ncbi:MAG: hypothetical protein LBT39_01360, partial [Treponema sp.]|nr:hypothetical protein [Treponema sp.]
MSIPAVAFKGLLTTLAGQFIDQGQNHAECIDDDFGNQVHQNIKSFFSIAIIEEDLPNNLAAVGILCDDSVSEYPRSSYTFFIYIDSSRKYENITSDLKAILFKLFLSHETCHFAFYYELFINLGADLTNTVYEQFQNTVSGRLSHAITNEQDITSQTVVEEHSYEELVKNVGKYPNSHFSKNNQTSLDYNSLFISF